VCGIAGVFNFRSLTHADAAAVQRMGDVVAHRGPDASGVYVDGPTGLAHRRLAILDLSDQGRQPMYSADGRFAMVFNGEIYNYLELRDELQRAGHHFRTQTDSEVLLTLYALEGPAALSRLQGMFAIGIWDAERRELFLARDRVGIKPLYYVETPDGLVFGSEAKSLFEYPGVPCDVDRDQIDTYMTFGYVPGARTLFRGVKKLLPGHALTVTSHGLTCREYWDVRYAPNHARDAEDTASQLHDLLLDVTNMHLRSDVPVGVFLSGGLDSSAVVSLLSEAGVSGIKTFSVAYRDGEAFDESQYAGLVSRHFGTTHHVLYVDPSHFEDFIPDYVWHMDEPVTEAAALSLYFISRELRQHVTVALSGEGADELFAGYQIYRYMLWLERYRQAPMLLRSHVAEPIAAMVPSGKVQKYLEMARLPLAERYLGVGVSEPWHRRALYSPSMRDPVTRPATEDVTGRYYGRSAGHDALSQMLYLDLKTWLVDDLLIKADKMTMANAVELRVPFLDHRVIEFAATVPSDLKLHRGVAKWILKKAMGARLPAEILQRRKMGFPTPLTQMFRGPLSTYLYDLLTSARAVARDYFDARRVRRLIAEHVSGRHDHHRVLWQLVVLEEWHRAFIDGHRDRSRPPADAPVPHGIAV
jgi:asparagine synthase (glutamine-hydrolysing)